MYWKSEMCTLALLLLLQCQGLLAAVQCYKCVYVPFAGGSDATCSDPWPWYRNVLGKSTLPPLMDCEHSCMKVLIGNQAHSPTVVRTCSKRCEEGRTATTITSCCREDLCNGATPSLDLPRHGLMTACLGLVWTLTEVLGISR